MNSWRQHFQNSHFVAFVIILFGDSQNKDFLVVGTAVKHIFFLHHHKYFPACGYTVHKKCVDVAVKVMCASGVMTEKEEPSNLKGSDKIKSTTSPAGTLGTMGSLPESVLTILFSQVC
jgi:hypothetical protein